jgi:hypothetical protein
VSFDWDDTGFRANTGWVGAGEGLLVLDRNANGQADSGRELFSTHSKHSRPYAPANPI